MALVCGNTMVIKPSPRNPLAPMFIMKLAQEAGVPDGCINVFHGTVERNISSFSSVIFMKLCKLFHKGKCLGKLVIMSKNCCRVQDLVKVFRPFWKQHQIQFNLIFQAVEVFEC